MGHTLKSKSFECNNNDIDFIGFRSGNGAVKENHNGVLKDREGNAKSLRFPMKYEDGLNQIATNHDSSVNVNEKGTTNFGTQLKSTHSSFEMESLEDRVFYMDKSVMERELPELIVCYEENTYHVVKDICIDEGVPSKDKFWFDTSVDEKNVSALLPLEKDITNERVKEKVDLDMPIHNVQKVLAEKENLDLLLPVTEMMKFSEEKQSKIDFSLDCVSKDLLPTGEAEHDAMMKIPKYASKDFISLGDLLSMPEFCEKLHHPKSSKSDINEVEQQPLKNPTKFEILATAPACKEFENSSEGVIQESPPFLSGEELDNSHGGVMLETTVLKSTSEKSDCSCDHPVVADPALVSTDEELNNGSKGAELASHSLDSTPEESTTGNAEESSYNRNMETGSITFDFNSCAPAASGKEDCPQNHNSEDHDAQTSSNSGSHDTQNLSRLEDTGAESVSSRLQYNHGESSFSAAVPVSGLISYSGPIAYSGSLSLRSDSSTTSTRSFAFPVLQSEWNSSPVRMAKAERRHFRKHRGWRWGLFCCKC